MEMMMTLRFNTTRIPAITPEQWAKVRELFTRKQKLTPFQLTRLTGMEEDPAHALLLGLHQEKLAGLLWLVIHGCSTVYVACRFYENGFQPVPWKCPECGENVRNSDELECELQARTHGPIEFFTEPIAEAKGLREMYLQRTCEGMSVDDAMRHAQMAQEGSYDETDTDGNVDALGVLMTEVMRFREERREMAEAWAYGKRDPRDPGFSTSWFVRLDRLLTRDSET